jgi:hypothetical protein
VADIEVIPTSADWRALCAELVDAIGSLVGGVKCGHYQQKDMWKCRKIFDRARTALAQPELQGPKPAPDYGRVPEIATEAQIRSAAQYLVTKQGCDGDLVPAIRYAIARWGRPAIKPVPVSERPWERDGWCDAEGMCWWGHLRRFQPENRIVHSWGLAAPGRLDASTVCLPHWALPLPTPTPTSEGD